MQGDGARIKVGILGGTFDPVHKVHLEMAFAALESGWVNVVLMLPTGQPVRKLGTTHASPQHRLNMLKAVCEGIEGLEVSSLEVDRPEITYTVDTLRELKQLYGENSQLYLILGKDVALDLPTWKEPEEIARLAHILYVYRPTVAEGLELPEGFTCFELPMPAQDVSSSAIRALLLSGKDVGNLVPAKALAYIQEQGLYGQPQPSL